MARLLSDESLAAITIFMEAEGESFIGKCAVGEVIRNRMHRHYSSDGTVAGTVCRAWQFSGWNTDAKNRIRSLKLDDTDAMVQECLKAWRTSQATSYARSAVLYCNLDIVARPDWAKEDKLVTKIGHHSFFLE